MNLQVSPTRKKHCQGRHLGVQLSKLCEVDVTTIIRIYLADHFMKLFLAHVLPKAFRHGTQFWGGDFFLSPLASSFLNTYSSASLMWVQECNARKANIFHREILNRGQNWISAVSMQSSSLASKFYFMQGIQQSSN